jgi:protein-disulfide isomerase
MKKQNGFLLVLVLLVVFFITACTAETSQKTPASQEKESSNSPTLESNTADLGESSQSPSQRGAEVVGVYQDIPAGITPEGYPYLGSLNAEVVMEEYSDFLCPFCSRHFNQTLPTLMEEYVKTGRVQHVFRDLPLASLHPTAPQGHVAARCVAQQEVGLFWEMHHQLFSRQNEWSRLSDPADYLAGVAEQIGADMTAYQECLNEGEAASQVETSIAAGSTLGFNGTPSFRFTSALNEEDYTLVGAHPAGTFSEWLDALLAGEEPPQDERAESEPPELPFWANTDGLVPDPDRPGYTLAGDQYKGDPEAKLVVIEFSDFQCPSCARHALETQPTIDRTFIQTGEILWVFKHFPLQIHPQAAVAAAAAECATDQGAFWEMKQSLYENQEKWGIEQPEPELISLAGDLNLDIDVFSACLNSRQPLERVLDDIYDAQGVVQSTPTFIGVYGGSGAVFRGARDTAYFVSLLENLLENAANADTTGQ